MSYLQYFSREYLAIMINTLEYKLQEYSCFTTFARQTKKGKQTYIREIEARTRKPLHEYSLISIEGQRLMHIMDQKRMLEGVLDSYKMAYHRKTGRNAPKIGIETINMLRQSNVYGNTMEVYKKLVNEQAAKVFGTKERPHTYKDMHFISKFEMGVAILLDDLKLMYKHEPCLKLVDKDKYSDFVVGVPMINACFPVEVAGLLENSQYSLRFVGDLKSYVNTGYLFDHDMLVIAETSGHRINMARIARIIASFVSRKVDEVCDELAIIIPH